MRLDPNCRCERRSGEPFLGGRSKVFSHHGLGAHGIARRPHRGNAGAWPFVLSCVSYAVAGRYKGGPSALK